MRNQFERERKEFEESKTLKYERALDFEMEKMEKEKVEAHAAATQQIYQEVMKVVSLRSKQSTKQKLLELREKLCEEFEMKLERRQNQMEASLARERQESARTNIVNARLE